MKNLLFTLAAALMLSQLSSAEVVNKPPTPTIDPAAKVKAIPAQAKRASHGKRQARRTHRPAKVAPVKPRVEKQVPSLGIDKSEALRFIVMNSNDIQVIANFTPAGFSPNPYSLTEYSFLQIQQTYKESGTTMRYDKFFCTKTAVADVFECSIPAEEPVPGAASKNALFTVRLKVVGSSFQMLPAAESMIPGEVSPAKSIRLDEVF